MSYRMFEKNRLFYQMISQRALSFKETVIFILLSSDRM